MSANPKSIKANIAVNLEIVRGDNITWQMTTQNIEDGLDANITGATLKFTVKADFNSAAVIEKTTSGGIVITDAANGIFQVSLVPADTSGLETGGYVFDVEITLSGKVGTIAVGEIEILKDVTI